MISSEIKPATFRLIACWYIYANLNVLKRNIPFILYYLFVYKLNLISLKECLRTLLNLWRGIVLEKLIVSHLLKKSLTFRNPKFRGCTHRNLLLKLAQSVHLHLVSLK
jgi:hypothetical protein